MNKYMQILLESDYADLMYRGMPKEYGEKLSALIAQEEAFQTMLTHRRFKMGDHFVMAILGE